MVIYAGLWMFERNRSRASLRMTNEVIPIHYLPSTIQYQIGEPYWARTSDTRIKSPVLYQLS